MFGLGGALRRSDRAVAGPLAYAGLAVVALIAFLLFAIFFPALLLALLFFIAGIAAFYFGRTSPYGIWIGLLFIVLAAVFGFLAVGQSVSLAIVHGV